MKNKAPSQRQKPIGVFDSGLGGLTIVREIRRKLPHESIIYYGDMARLPYGTKSREQILSFSTQNTLFLLKHRVKALVVACNSSSSVAYSFLKKNFKLEIVDVIQPAIAKASVVSIGGRIAVLATQATIDSLAYQKGLRKANKKNKVFSIPCPLFVPLVEEGHLGDSLAHQVIHNYLKPILKKKVDTLILGCTHYPLLRKAIQKVIGNKVNVVDSAVPTVDVLANRLEKQKLLNLAKRKAPLKVFVSDKPRNFVRVAEKFLGEKLRSVKVVRQK